jgi:transforming growth factor-beta-induced protein
MSIQNWKFNTTDNGNFFWEAISNTGEILGRSSQNFKSQNGAKYNADLLGRSGNYSQKLAWEFMQDKENNWIWKADNTVNKENVASTHKPFATKIEAVKNATFFGYKGEFVSLLKDDANIDNNQKSSTNSTVKDKKANVAPLANNLNIVKTSTPEKYDERIYTNDNQEDSTSWWKWLLLGLLILGLLYWLLPLLTKKAEPTNIDFNVGTSINQSSGILGVLQNPNFGVLSGAVKSANLTDTINKSTPLTILAPTNEAFQNLSPEILSNIQKPENVNQLQNTLKNHLFNGNINLNELKDGSVIKSLAGNDLPIKIDNGKLLINGVEIDKNIDSTSTGFSVYSIPKLLDLPINNPKSETTPVSALENPKSEYKAGSNLDLLYKNGNFKTLLAAINVADLKTILEGDGPFTIFAPDDEAMKSVQPTLNELLKPENKQKLQSFLKNHVALGKNTYQEFKASKIVTNLNDQRVILRTNNEGIGRVEGFKNTSLAPVPDIITNNGVIHTLTDSPLLI